LIILDTDILVNILRKKNRGREWKEFLKNKTVAFTTITAFELFLGAELSKKRNQNMKSVENLIQQFPVLALSIKSARIASISIQIYRKKEKLSN